MAMYGVVLEDWQEDGARPQAAPLLAASGLHTAEGFAAIEDGTALVQPESQPQPDLPDPCSERNSRVARWLAALRTRP